MISEDAQIRLQCAEMANRQPFNMSAEDVAASAQRLYEFVTNTKRQPPEGKTYAPKRGGVVELLLKQGSAHVRKTAKRKR